MQQFKIDITIEGMKEYINASSQGSTVYKCCSKLYNVAGIVIVKVRIIIVQ